MNRELLFSSSKKEWETPPNIFDPLNKIFKFNLDVCANHQNTKVKKYFGLQDNGEFIDGLKQDWRGNCFMNPPYGYEIKHWVKKAFFEVYSQNANCVIGLLPSRTDTSWYHSYILQRAIVFNIPGRITFHYKGKPLLDKNKKPLPAPFPSIVVIWMKFEFKKTRRGQPPGKKSDSCDHAFFGGK